VVTPRLVGRLDATLHFITTSLHGAIILVATNPVTFARILAEW